MNASHHISPHPLVHYSRVACMQWAPGGREKAPTDFDVECTGDLTFRSGLTLRIATKYSTGAINQSINQSIKQSITLELLLQAYSFLPFHLSPLVLRQTQLIYNLPICFIT